MAPGFISAHSHLFTSGSRGLATDESLYGWIEAMTCYTRQAEPEDLYWLTLHGAVDFLCNGITTAYDFASSRLAFRARTDGSGHYEGSLAPAELLHSQLLAKADSGIRFLHSTMLEEAWTSGPAQAIDAAEERLAYEQKLEGNPHYLGSAISGGVQWAPGPELAEAEAVLMRRHGLINQPHFLETPFRVKEQQERFSWYRQAGALGPQLIFGHFIHTTPEMVAEAARAGCGMVWQPVSNGRLASGIAPIPSYMRAGMRVGMGLDDQSCTDIADPWQNMRFGLYLLRAATQDPRVLGVREVLWLHTVGSARVLGLEDQLGSLEVGKWADFLVVDPSEPDTGPVWDPYGTYVLACGLRNLKQVWVGGRMLASDGRPTAIDRALVRDQVHQRLARLSERVGSSSSSEAFPG
ncbi:MAG TPA: amidohydrolase family protein [Acidimicrobiales bacterium]|nr:amidohydrolase family protein [Acidimicrobiales bacterium]